jgi:hypothetical protein
MRIQPTRIEELDAQHPGLRQRVDLMLDAQETLEAIVKRVKAESGEDVPQQTISSYKQRRWLPARLRIAELKESFRAIKDEIGENAIAESTQARIMELLDHAIRAGAKFDANLLLIEQRKWAEADLKRQQVEQANKQLELKIEAAKRSLEESAEEATKKVAGGGQITIEDINKIRARTFGLPPIGEAAHDTA